MKAMACRSDYNKTRTRYLSWQPRINQQYTWDIFYVVHYFPIQEMWQNPTAAEVGSIKKSCGD